MQASRPLATDGLIVSPGGNVTDMSLTCEVVSVAVSDSPSWGTPMVATGPVGVSGRVVSGSSAKSAANGTSSQPVAPSPPSIVGVWVIALSAPPPSEVMIRRVESLFPVQAVGLARNGMSGSGAGLGVGSGEQTRHRGTRPARSLEPPGAQGR